MQLSSTLQVPGFTLPFNIVGWVVWAVLLRVEMPVKEAEDVLEDLVVDDQIDLEQLFIGSLVAISQVASQYYT